MNFELLKTFTILYVEDEKSLRIDIYENIIPFVKKIIIAVDGKDGLEKFMDNRGSIDLIVSDILMPNMNGIEMNDEIRKLDLEIPIIYTTAFNDSDFMKKTITQSVTEYILKPIDIELLLKGIQKASLKIENEKLKISLMQINQNLEEKVKLKTKELVNKNEELYIQLYRDDLTSLKNRKAFFRDLKSYKNPIVSIVDIDSFKTINDLYGESVGNTILVSIAGLLENYALQNNCTVYRTGSNEFTILKDEEFKIEKCIKNSKSIISSIKENPIYSVKHNITIRVDVTIGISAQNEETFIKADMALKRAKAQKVEFLIYSDEHNLEAEYANDIKWTSIIEKSFKNNSTKAFYQPIVDVDGNIVKHETLMRIVENDVVHLPFNFLDISKKVKLYGSLEKSILLQAFAQAKKHQTKLSVNLSIEDIINKEFIDFIRNELIKNNIASLIVFEILESESIEDYEKVVHFIELVKSLGSTIAIDDFGSGYSNFAYLLKLKPDYIKLDGSFIKNIDTDKNSYLIAKNINDFTHKLGMKTIAEFVHSKEVFEVLKELGVDEFQGYYFWEPLAEIQL